MVHAVGGITTNYRILRNNKRVQKNNKAFFTTTRAYVQRCHLQRKEQIMTQGYEFNKELQTGKNRYGEPTHFIRYSLGGKS